LTVTVAAQPVDGGVPSIEIFTFGQLAVPVTVLTNADGRFRVQATGLAAGTDYFVRLRGTTAAEIGNYALTVLVGKTVAQLDTVDTGALSTFKYEALTFEQSQIHYFLLSNAGALASAVRMIIRDPNGNIVVDLLA